jgi:hypothetical protein
MPKPPSSISERSPLAGVDQLFKKTSDVPLPPPPAAVKVVPEPPKNIRPKEPKERVLVQTSLRLYEDQLSWLENLIYKAKRNGSSTAVSNSALFRSLLELCRERNISLRGVDSDEELKAKLKKAFNLI